MTEDLFAPRRFWARFPAAYRSREMKILAEWITAGESGSAVGLSGTGRATLLGFLCHRPEVLQSYQPENSRQIILVPVDLINLPVHNLATLYRTILRSFYEIHPRFEHTAQILIRDNYRRTETSQDPFLPQSALRELLFFFQAQEIGVGLVMNRFDRFCQNATLQMTNTLRGLRDSFKETLFYIVSLPQEVVYLSHLDCIAPLRGILDTNTCWVGPLNQADARRMIAYRTRRLRSPLSEQTVCRLLDLTGGFPSLIRVACDWRLTLEKEPSRNRWADILLQKQNMQHRLSEMWNGLTQEEQQVLSELAQYQPLSNQLEKQHSHVLSRLGIKGVCRRDAAGWRVAGRLPAAYAANKAGQSRGRVWLDEQTGDIYQGRKVVENLPPLGRSVLHFLIKHPRVRHTHTALIEAAWPDAVLKEGVSTEALYQVIRSIRKKIEPDPAHARYIVNWRGQPEGGYQFFPEGKPAV